MKYIIEFETDTIFGQNDYDHLEESLEYILVEEIDLNIKNLKIKQWEL